MVLLQTGSFQSYSTVQNGPVKLFDGLELKALKVEKLQEALNMTYGFRRTFENIWIFWGSNQSCSVSENTRLLIRCIGTGHSHPNTHAVHSMHRLRLSVRVGGTVPGTCCSGCSLLPGLVGPASWAPGCSGCHL